MPTRTSSIKQHASLTCHPTVSESWSKVEVQGEVEPGALHRDYVESVDSGLRTATIVSKIVQYFLQAHRSLCDTDIANTN